MPLKAFLLGVGRINRRSFWLWHSLLLAGGLSATLAIIVALGWGASALAPRIALVAIWAALIWLWGAQAVRRLHDFGRPASFVAAPLALWAGLLTVALLAPLWRDPASEGWVRIAFLASTGLTSLGLASLIWVGLSRGDHRANRFGPPTWIAHPDPPGMHPDQAPLSEGDGPPK